MLDAQLSLASGLGQNPPLGNEDNMFAREFLFKLADKASLDLLERSELWHWHEDDDGFLATNIHFLGGVDVKFTKLSLQVGIQLQVKKGMSDRVFKLVGLLTSWLDDL